MNEGVDTNLNICTQWGNSCSKCFWERSDHGGVKALNELWVMCLGVALEEGRVRAHPPLRNRECSRYQLNLRLL